MLRKYQLGIGTIVEELRQQTHAIAVHSSMKYQGKEHAKRARADFEFRLTPFFHMGTEQALFLFKRMRTSVYLLSGVGQAEAMSRALDLPQGFKASHGSLAAHLDKETPSGGSVQARIDLAFHRLLRDIIDAYQLSQTLESSPQEILDRIDRAFPRSRRIARRAPMAKLSEAGRSRGPWKGPELNISEEGIEPQAWKDAVDDYLDTYIPYGRGPADALFYPVEFSKTGDTDLLEAPSWELEREVTEDFVNSVRAGEIEAAKQNGITDMIWIAVIDGSTDECCADRDGLTTAEIEAQLDSLGGDCDAIVPPAHYNCRCRVAPMTDDMPKVESPDFSSFDSWLRDKENPSEE